MKSHRAEEYILAFEFGGHGGYRVISSANARRAVEQAEQEARERAVKAFCRDCQDDANGCAETGEMHGKADCTSCELFLEIYDNEQ